MSHSMNERMNEWMEDGAYRLSCTSTPAYCFLAPLAPRSPAPLPQSVPSSSLQQQCGSLRGKQGDQGRRSEPPGFEANAWHIRTGIRPYLYLSKGTFKLAGLSPLRLPYPTLPVALAAGGQCRSKAKQVETT